MSEQEKEVEVSTGYTADTVKAVAQVKRSLPLNVGICFACTMSSSHIWRAFIMVKEVRHNTFKINVHIIRIKRLN